MAGTIVGHEGEDYYTVELIGEKDKSGDPLEVSVKQLQISGATIPYDTAVIVVAAGDKYYMQVPVYV